MINERHLATIRAALRYWHDEMASHDQTLSRPYFREHEAEPLNSDEVLELIRTLELTIIRPVMLDARTGRLIENGPWISQKEVGSQADAEQPIEATLLFEAKLND